MKSRRHFQDKNSGGIRDNIFDFKEAVLIFKGDNYSHQLILKLVTCECYLKVLQKMSTLLEKKDPAVESTQ